MMNRYAGADDPIRLPAQAIASPAKACAAATAMNRAPSAFRPMPGGADPATDPAADRQRAAAIRLDRACTELRRGRPVVLGTSHDWLLAAAEGAAWEHDAISMRLEVRKDNAASLALFERHTVDGTGLALSRLSR